MDLSDLLEPERIRCQCDVHSKKRTLQTLAELLGQSLRARTAVEGEGVDSAEDAETSRTAEQDAGKDGHRDTHRGPRLSRITRPSRRHGEKSADSARESLSDMQILDALISRERLGSTGLGHGVGLPHSRLASIDEPIAAVVTLAEGVDYEAADGQRVDLVLGLLVPEDCNEEHLQILAQLARRFSDDNLRESLRGFTDPDRLYQHLAHLEPASG